MFEMFCDQYFLCIFTFSKNELLKLTETLIKTHLNFNGLNRCLFVYIHSAWSKLCISKHNDASS